MIKILTFAGSARRASFNQKLAACAASMARELGAEVSLIDMADFPMPIYDGDLEESAGIPENASRLRNLMVSHDAFLIACPEYNGSITALLKNAIDWTSRPTGEIGMSSAYAGKVAGLLSASPGDLGGMRGLVHVRAILSGMGVLVVPGDASVSAAHQAFAEDGKLGDQRAGKRVAALVKTLVETTSALRRSKSE